MITRRQALVATVPSMACAPWPAAAAPDPAWSAKAPGVPDVTLLDHEGKPVSLRPLLAQGPVAVNFIYTGCVSFCPPQTAVFRQLQSMLQAEPRLPATLVSLSIDPLSDTPQALTRYAQRFEAPLGPAARWRMLTGDVTRMREVDAVLAAFGAHPGTLADHPSQVWVGSAPKGRWMRALGLAPATDILRWLRMAAA